MPRLYTIRERKILRDLLARKGRTFLVSTAIFIGVAGTITLFSMSDILVRQLDATVNEQDIAMVNVLVTVHFGARLNNQAYLDLLKQSFESIQEVQASKQSAVFFKLSADDSEIREANLFSYSSPFDELKIEPMHLRQGDYPQERMNQVAIEQRFADRYGLAVGDQIFFRVVRRSFEPSLRRIAWEAWTVSGIVFHPYVLSPANAIYATLRDHNYLTGTQGYSVFSSRFTDYPIAHRQANAFSAIIADHTPYIPVFTQRQDPAFNPLTVGARRLSATLNLLSLIALFVSGFIVVNVISSIIAEQRRQIGAMKAIGATQFDILRMYCGLALAYGILGVIPGILLGVPAGYFLAEKLALQVNAFLEHFTISYRAVMIGTGAGIAIPVLTSILPVIDGMRVTILEAMTDSGIKATYKPGIVGRLSKALPLPFMLQWAIRNLGLKKVRVILTVATLAVAVGAFMGILAVFNSVDKELSDFLDRFQTDLSITPDVQADPELVLSLLESYLDDETDLAAVVEPVFQVSIEIEGYESLLGLDPSPTITAYGYDVSSDFQVEISEGETLTPDNERDKVILSHTLAEKLGKEIGDTITVTVLGRSNQWLVSGTTDDPLERVWVSWQTMARAAGYEAFVLEPNRYFTTLIVDGAREVTAVALDEQVGGLVNITQGEPMVTTGGGVIISQGMADHSGYRVGDTITLRSGENTQTYPISGIFSLPLESIAGQPIPSDLVGMPWQDLAVLEGHNPEDLPLPYTYLLDTAGELTADQLDSLASELDELLLQAGISTELFNFVGLLEILSTNLRTFQVILSAVALLIGLVGALGLLSTLSMSVYERQREIGVMRSVGATSGIVMLQFLTEGLLVGFAAWVLGLPIAYVLSNLILDVTGLSDTLNAVFSLQAVLAGLLGIMVITTLASLLPALVAARHTVSDILRYQ